jgi:hypothetical protein
VKFVFQNPRHETVNWLYDLRSGDLLTYDDEAGQWGAPALPVDDQDV